VNPLDTSSLLAWLGPWSLVGVFFMVFAETGLLVGFFLPGDSLLFSVGLLCAGPAGAGRLSLPWALAAEICGAVLGAQTGYVIGRRAGLVLSVRSRSRRVRHAMARADALLARTGLGPALVAARFVPVVRGVIGPVAGMLEVPTRTYFLWQLLGGLLWTVSITMTGYTLGRAVPGLDAWATRVIVLAAVAFPVGLAGVRADDGFADRRPSGVIDHDRPG
jgi:membrane-associated protein